MKNIRVISWMYLFADKDIISILMMCDESVYSGVGDVARISVMSK